MNVEISFRNLEHTPALDELIRKKSERMTRLFSGGAVFNWVCWTDKNAHTSTLNVKDQKREFFVKAEADSMYKSIDLALGKLSAQVEHEH